MYRIFFLLLSCLTGYSGVSQSPDFETIAKTAKALYPDDNFVVWKSIDAYSFSKSPDRSSPITAKQTANREIVKLKNGKDLVYSQYTNSHSVIRFVSASAYNKSRDKFTNGVVHTSSIAYESGGIFHNDYFVNPIFIAGSSESNLYQLKYSKIVDDYKFLSFIPLFSNYGTLESEVSIDVPSWMGIRLIERNFESYEIEKTEAKASDGTKSYIYKWKNIPNFESEQYSASSLHYIPHVILVYETYDRNGKPEKLMPNTEDLYAWYRDLVSQIEDDPTAINDLIRQFKDIPKGMEQISAVNEWISENIRYIAFESGIAGFKPDACQKVYRNKYGDCKGMANLCKQVLKGLGYDARLAWIGTRKEVPYTYDIPSLMVDNHMITAVKLDGDFIFLDPTETWGKSHWYAFRIQGRPVLIENGDSFLIQTVPESDQESDKITRTCTIDFNPATKFATYTIEEFLYGEPKKYLVHGYNGQLASNREDALIRYLRRNDQGTFNLLEHEGLDNSLDFVRLKYSFTTAEGMIDLGNEIYLDLDPSDDLEDAKLAKERKSNWYFDERYNRSTKISFKIPPGYKINHHPQDVNIHSEDFQLLVTHQLNRDFVEIEKKFKVRNGEISSQNKAAWESGIHELKNYYEDRFILLKDE